MLDHEECERTASAEIRFELYEYRAGAARVKVIEDGEEYMLWMSPKDIRDNLKEHGESKGLRDALEAYRIDAMPNGGKGE